MQATLGHASVSNLVALGWAQPGPHAPIVVFTMAVDAGRRGGDRPYWQALDEAVDPADAEQRLRQVVAQLEQDYPSAAGCLAEDLPALCVHLKCFPRLRKRFRYSNLLERSLEEVRRRTKVIGRFAGEKSCLSLCWAVLDIFIGGARGLGLTDLGYRQVVQLKVAPIWPRSPNIAMPQELRHPAFPAVLRCDLLHTCRRSAACERRPCFGARANCVAASRPVG